MISILGELIELLEIIGGKIKMLAPIETQPANVPLDGLDILHVLCLGVGVIETQMADAAIFLGYAEIERNRLGMADVQEAVRLRREAGDHSAIISAGAVIFGDDFSDEIFVFGNWCGVCHGDTVLRVAWPPFTPLQPPPEIMGRLLKLPPLAGD